MVRAGQSSVWAELICQHSTVKHQRMLAHGIDAEVRYAAIAPLRAPRCRPFGGAAPWRGSSNSGYFGSAMGWPATSTGPPCADRQDRTCGGRIPLDENRVPVECVVGRGPGPGFAPSVSSWWIGLPDPVRGVPVPPRRVATISAAMDRAVSSGVRAPRSRPIGARSRDNSWWLRPASRSRRSRSACVRREPNAPT